MVKTSEKFLSSRFREVIEKDINDNKGNYMVLKSPQYASLVARTRVTYNPVTCNGEILYLDAGNFVLASYYGNINSPEVPRLGKIEEVNTRDISQKAYNDSKCKNYHIRFNLDDDHDIIERLESAKNGDGGLMGYIRTLVRKDIEAKAN